MAEAYDRERPSHPTVLVDAACTIADLDAGSRVLEIGCGTGKLTWHSLAEPAGHELPVAPCAAAVAVDAGMAAVVAAAPGVAGRLVVAEVGADGSRRDLAWLGSGKRRVGAIDYAGGIALVRSFVRHRL